MSKKKRKPKSAVLPEYDTVTQLLHQARQLGIEHEFRNLYRKYQSLLQKCTNPQEKEAISTMANVDLHKLFNFQNALVVDGVELIPAAEGFKEDG